MSRKGSYRVPGAPPVSERSCGFSGCAGKVHSGYFCQTHYAQQRRTGEMQVITPLRRGGICGEVDCNGPHKARGLCKRHYELSQYRGVFPVRKCSAADCEMPAKKRGLCITHYARARRAGALDGPTCRVDGCNTYAARVGRCDRHAKRASLYGLDDIEMARIDAGVPCEICRIPSEVVDHCHSSGLVRGYLCKHCNTAIGLLRDNPGLAESAATYLRRVAHVS